MGSRVAACALAALVGCASEDRLGPPSGPVPFTIFNALLAPVTVSIDGAPIVIIGSGRSSGLTAQPSIRALTWTSAKPTDLAGLPIPDDIHDVRIPVPAADSTVEITNRIGGEPYFTAGVFNRTPTTVSVAIVDDGMVVCAGTMPLMSAGVRGYVQTGYFKLRANTEVRAYRDPSNCTGPYVTWPHSALLSLAPKSGLVVLTLDTSP